jgi:WhiB family redox-sensing transcriptional regulator
MTTPDHIRKSAVEIAQREGLVAAQLATGVPRASIRNWCVKDGIDYPRLRTQWTTEQRATAVDHAKAHGTIAAAKLLGCSVHSVREWCAKEGVTPANSRPQRKPKPPKVKAVKKVKVKKGRGPAVSLVPAFEYPPVPLRPSPAPVAIPPLDHIPAEKWWELGECKGSDPEAWFPGQGAPSPTIGDMKATCAACPVRVDCLTAALDEGEKFGIWGGASERERRAMRRDWPRIACGICKQNPVAYERAVGRGSGSATRPICETCAAKRTLAEREASAEASARYRLGAA